MVDKVMAKVAAGKIELHLWSTLDEVLGDSSGVTGVRLRHKDGATREIALKGCFIAIGHQPNTDIFKRQLEMKDGYIITRGGQDGLATIGLIGSSAKWGRFRKRLLTEGGFTESDLSRVTTPIGLPQLGGKDPAVIAVSVAAALLKTVSTTIEVTA